MVWFYLFDPVILVHLDNNFQSHYGLILSLNGYSLTEHKYWLSIPLWSDFIAVYPEMTLPALKCFQSHYGLILSIRWTFERLIPHSTFNPTMVWFYHVNYHVVAFVWENFQSHYGLILSFEPLSVRNRAETLSIPLWSDFIQQLHALKQLPNSTFNPTMVWFYPLQILHH